MPYALSLTFDEQADAAIRKIWRALADAGINDLFDRIGVPPHVSLAVYEEIDQTPLVAAIKSFCAQTSALDVWLAAIGVFPGEENVLFVQPKVTPELIELYAAYHRLTEGLGVCHPHYLPEAWMPHCTLGMPLSRAELGRALSEIADLGETWKPMRAELCRVRLIAYPEDLSGTPNIETLFSGALRR